MFIVMVMRAITATTMRSVILRTSRRGQDVKM